MLQAADRTATTVTSLAARTGIRDSIVSTERRADTVFAGWRSRHGRESTLVEDTSAASSPRTESAPGPVLLPRIRRSLTSRRPTETSEFLDGLSGTSLGGSSWQMGLSSKTATEVR
jgi:hypothetical protein